MTKNALKLRVEGMDCGACALKIESALKRLPGVSDIDVNYGLQSLALAHDEDRTSRRAIEDKIKALGYTPVALSSATGSAPQASSSGRGPGVARWWRSRKGRLVIGIGALLAAAFTMAQIDPVLSRWAYVAAAVVGLMTWSAGGTSASAYSEGGTCTYLPPGVHCVTGTNSHSFTCVYASAPVGGYTYICSSAVTDAGNYKQNRSGSGGDCSTNAITHIGCFLALPMSIGHGEFLGGGSQDLYLLADTNGGGIC